MRLPGFHSHSRATIDDRNNRRSAGLPLDVVPRPSALLCIRRYIFPHEHLWKSNVRFIGPVEFSVEENGQAWTPVKTRFFVVTNLTMFIIKYGIKPGSEKVLPPKFAAQLKAVYRDEVSPMVELQFEDRKSSTFFADAGDFALAQSCKWRINTKKPAMDRIIGALTTCLAIANQPGNRPLSA